MRSEPELTIPALTAPPDVCAPLQVEPVLVSTSVTLTAGSRGGEVTPLLFVGATLGNLLRDRAENVPGSHFGATSARKWRCPTEAQL